MKRGQLLRILLECYPEPESLFVLQGVLEKMGLPTTIETVKQYVSYLHEKGYCEVKSLKGRSGVKMLTVRLTAKGIDLLDENNNLQDEGVAI